MPKPTAKEVEAAHSRIYDRATRVAKARAALERQERYLEDELADVVTTAPASRTWYTRPGVLTIDQALGAATPANVTEAKLDTIMQRVRKRLREEPKRRRRRSSSSAPATTTPAADERPPGF